MRCPKCGTANAGGAQRCVACGAPLAGRRGEPASSGMATASLVLGILGVFCGVTALPGLILGIVALSQISRSAGRLKGQGVAIAGVVVSGLWLALFACVALAGAALMPALERARDEARAAACQSNLHQLGFALALYETDWAGLPPADSWCDALLEGGHAEDWEVFRCPAASEKECGYALNANLAGATMASVAVPSKTVVLFESDAGWNASGGRELMVATPRHARGYVILFADLHVDVVPPDRLDDLVWEP